MFCHVANCICTSEIMTIWHFINQIIIIRDVNETRETRDSKKFLGIEIYISRLREFETVH